MPARALDLLDLPTIARYRNDVLTLDSARALTRGHPFGALGLLAYINPARHLYAAAMNEKNSPPLIGGIIHTRGETFAKLLYLAPASNLDPARLPELLDHLAKQAGAWQAWQVLAEVEETHPIFSTLRTAGFSVYAWQRLWDATALEKTESRPGAGWRRAQAADLPAIQNLHYQIVPPLLQPIESAPTHVRGFFHAESKCYANVSSGGSGIMITPLIHPEENDLAAKLKTLAENLPERRGRKIYINVRSYQTWLEPALEDLGAKPATRQAVMVKHLTRFIKDNQPARTLPASGTVQASHISRMDVDE
ncbi:MAG: hypothetical protein IT310_13250 [Anaerolineales bacterium]|nr:hypothetical protein [Anaerolineales bacterium]